MNYGDLLFKSCGHVVLGADQCGVLVLHSESLGLFFSIWKNRTNTKIKKNAHAIMIKNKAVIKSFLF